MHLMLLGYSGNAPQYAILKQEKKTEAVQRREAKHLRKGKRMCHHPNQDLNWYPQLTWLILFHLSYWDQCTFRSVQSRHFTTSPLLHNTTLAPSQGPPDYIYYHGTVTPPLCILHRQSLEWNWKKGERINLKRREAKHLWKWPEKTAPPSQPERSGEIAWLNWSERVPVPVASVEDHQSCKLRIPVQVLVRTVAPYFPLLQMLHFPTFQILSFSHSSV